MTKYVRLLVEIVKLVTPASVGLPSNAVQMVTLLTVFGKWPAHISADTRITLRFFVAFQQPNADMSPYT
jgi:hypothetical protein